jgi:hypothetical protein
MIFPQLMLNLERQFFQRHITNPQRRKRGFQSLQNLRTNTLLVSRLDIAHGLKIKSHHGILLLLQKRHEIRLHLLLEAAVIERIVNEPQRIVGEAGIESNVQQECAYAVGAKLVVDGVFLIDAESFEEGVGRGAIGVGVVRGEDGDAVEGEVAVVRGW